MKDQRSFGATLVSKNTTRFCVWAPEHEKLFVELIGGEQVIELEMEASADGFHSVEASCGADQLYKFRLGERSLPDPASRFQPDGVHGPSQVTDPFYAWTDHAWTGVAMSDLVIYELHIGALTESGTYAGAVDRLDELAELGITAIELMPVSASAGRWNWGYDGVCPFAPFAPYGTPDDLKRLVDEAHQRGIAVILDVVYNHLGPEGNYLSQFGPYLSSQHNTIWGAAPNFDDPLHGDIVRQYFIEAALIWLREYHIDGLRVDAIHCMRDDSDRHIAIDMSEAIKSFSETSGRPATLIAESNVYDPNMLDDFEAGGVGFDAEWCDDFLHSVFAVLRPGEQLCHRKYQSSDLEQTLRYGYVFKGTLRESDQRCTPSERVDTSGLIYSIQHHDFIGNHPLGKRLHQLIGKDAQRAAAALLVLSPGIPMLFMGEEFCCQRPFQFFVDFGDEHLRNGVVEGRKREYPQHDWSRGILPTDPEAFLSSKIGSADQGDLEMRHWYQQIIQLRRRARRSNLICDQNLDLQIDSSAGLYVLRYESDQESLLVVVRLVADGDAGELDITSEVPGISDYQQILDSRSGSTKGLLSSHARVFSRNF